MAMTNQNKARFKEDAFVSIVLVARPDSVDVTAYCKQLSYTLLRKYSNHEILVIDNDLNANTVRDIIAMLPEYPCLRLIRLSRRYGHDTAIFAGIEAAIGDSVVIADPMVDPIDAIHDIVELNKKADIVQGVAGYPTGKAMEASVFRRLFYWYNRKYLGIDIPLRATYFIAISRRALRAITQSSRNDGHIRHLAKTIGYSYAQFVYTPLADPARSIGLKTGALEALEVVSSHSTHPLRFMSWVGFFASAINLIYAAYVLVVALLKPHVAEGWTTMSLQLSLMFFILFLFMVVLSEYTGKILNEARKDARYLVMDELCSTISLADAERKNVTKES